MTVLSRTAETMYWIGRYIERAECTARVIIEHVHLHVDLPRGLEVGWDPLLVLTGSDEAFLDHHGPTDDAADEEAVLAFLVGADGRNPGSITSSLAMARENLRATRPTAPPEAWASLNTLYLAAVEQVEEGIDRRTRYRYLQQIVDGCQRLAGVFDGTMNHDQVHAFLCVGRDIERADMTTRVIDVRAETIAPGRQAIGRPFDEVQWMSVLRSVAAYQMYRRAMGVEVQGPRALRFLLQDRTFPRSVMFCLDRMADQLKGLPRPETPLEACAQARMLLHEAGLPSLESRQLRLFIDEVQVALDHVHNTLAETYFEPDHLADRDRVAALV